MNANVWVLTFADAFSIATTLILATIGAILTERSGVINLGVEGILLMGAVTAFLVGGRRNSLGVLGRPFLSLCHLRLGDGPLPRKAACL